MTLCLQKARKITLINTHSFSARGSIDKIISGECRG